MCMHFMRCEMRNKNALLIFAYHGSLYIRSDRNACQKGHVDRRQRAKRIRETAREAEADNDPATLDRALGKIIGGAEKEQQPTRAEAERVVTFSSSCHL